MLNINSYSLSLASSKRKIAKSVANLSLEKSNDANPNIDGLGARRAI